MATNSVILNRPSTRGLEVDQSYLCLAETDGKHGDVKNNVDVWTDFIKALNSKSCCVHSQSAFVDGTWTDRGRGAGDEDRFFLEHFA
jgi:hypothetical protein